MANPKYLNADKRAQLAARAKFGDIEAQIYMDAVANGQIQEDLSSQVTGSATAFTTSQGFQLGTLLVYIDDIPQNGIPGVVSITNASAGTFSLGSAPSSGQKLFVTYSRF